MTNARGADWLTDDVVTAVRRHMNSDHVEDNTLIVRALGGVSAADSAELIDIDVNACIFAAIVGENREEVRVPFATPLVDRPQIRAEVVRMYNEACAQLGVTPRGEGDH